MRLIRILTLTIAALAVSAPGISDAGGRLGMGRGHVFREPSSTISTFPMSPRTHRRFDRNPFGGFGGTAVIPWDPSDTTPYVVVPEPVQVPVPVVVRDVPPPEPPVADPKFVFPPAPSAPEPAGSHTVIVQRGSKIEVQSFPATR